MKKSEKLSMVMSDVFGFPLRIVPARQCNNALQFCMGYGIKVDRYIALEGQDDDGNWIGMCSAWENMILLYIFTLSVDRFGIAKDQSGRNAALVRSASSDKNKNTTYIEAREWLRRLLVNGMPDWNNEQRKAFGLPPRGDENA